jgi:predicted DCC family thiol-disulfide oxidoreductase YuxK
MLRQKEGEVRFEAALRLAGRPGGGGRARFFCVDSGKVPDGFLSPWFYLTAMENSHETSVLFNATCPVCNFEIQHYARYSIANDLPIRFDDLNSDARGKWGLDADTAARRLYVLHEGRLTSGIPAFLVLWAQMPRYRRLARVVGLPGIRQIACAVYDFVLAPAIYRWHLHRLRRQTTRPQG